jgi:hypothetical protein
MVDFTATQAQAKGTTPVINHEAGQWPTFARASQTMAMVATPLNPLPPSSADGVDRLHH